MDLPPHLLRTMRALQAGRSLLRDYLPSPFPALIESVVVLFAFMGTAVVLNVLGQIFRLRDPTQPPQVFHYVPVIGCAISYGLDPLGFFERCRKTYGPVFQFPLLGRIIVVALGPGGSNFVLNSPAKAVSAEAAYTNLTTPVFGKGVVYDTENHVFMQQKAIIKKGLTTDNFRIWVPIVVKEVKEYLEEKVFRSDGSPISLDPVHVAAEITICSASATLQGEEVRKALDGSFAQLFADLDGGFTPLNLVFTNLPLPSFRRRDAAQAKMREFYLSILEKRRGSKEEPPADFLTVLQNQYYKDGSPLTDEHIAHLCIALLMGGQHTSAATGAWAILRLAENPSWRERLFQEQVEVWGDGHGGLNPLSYDGLQTPLLTAFVKELLRVHPPLHSLLRKVVEDIDIPSSVASPAAEPRQPVSFRKHNEYVNYHVPRGSYVLAAPGFTAVDEQFWGRDGRKFRAERWLDGSTKKLQKEEDQGQEDYGWGAISKGGKSPYIPFGAGRHRCIGEQFAMLQISALIATLVREAKWTLDSGKIPENDYTTMIVMPKPERNVIFVRRG